MCWMEMVTESTKTQETNYIYRISIHNKCQLYKISPNSSMKALLFKSNAVLKQDPGLGP